MKLARPLALVLLLGIGCSPEAPAPSNPGGNAGAGGSAGSGGRGGSSAGSAGTGGSATGGSGGAGGQAGGSGGSGGSAGSAGSGGSAGSAGTGGSRSDAGRPADGRAPDRGRASDAGGTDAGAAAPVPPDGFGGGALTECTAPSLGRLLSWSGHALTSPGPGASLLVKQGDQYVAKVHFNGGGFSEAVLKLANPPAATADLSKSAGFTLRYTATADLYVQIRGTVQEHGGDQHLVKLPATGNMIQSLSVRFVPEAWTFLPGLGKPRVALADVVKSATIFDFVGTVPNDVVFHSLRFDSYAPACP